MAGGLNKSIPNHLPSSSENALRLLNRISAQFHIGHGQTPPVQENNGGGHSEREISLDALFFVPDCKLNAEWLAELPKAILDEVSLKKVRTKGVTVKYSPQVRTQDAEDAEAPRTLRHSQFVLVPTSGDVEQWTTAADFCRGYLSVVEDSYVKARAFDLNTALTPFRHMLDKEKSTQTAWCKYYTAAPMAQILHETLPDSPLGKDVRVPVFFSGKFRQFMHKRALPCLGRSKIPSTRNLRCCFNLLQGVKRACPEISREFILQGYKDHQTTLSAPCDCPVSTPEQGLKYLQLWGNCPRSVQAWKEFEPRISKAPGSSATFESTRKQGGGNRLMFDENRSFDSSVKRAAETIVNKQLEQFLDSLEILDALRPYLQPAKEAEQCSSGPRFWIFPNGINPESGGSPNGGSTEREPVCSKRILTPDLTIGEESFYFTPSWDEVMKTYESQDPDNRKVMVEGVPEPLKLRSITKGPCKRKWLCQSLQQEMAQCLSRMWQFTLNTANTDHKLIAKLEEKCVALHQSFKPELQHGDYGWCSGDYKGATDRISIHQTKAGLEALLVKMDPERIDEAMRQLFRDELYEQEINYPVWTRLRSVQQANGQLMGSVLSFPILCAINFVAYWESLEVHLGAPLSARQVPCLIHGDDILFKTTAAHYKCWSDRIEHFGLKKSVGKNYFHQKVFTIDSELWIESRQGEAVSFKKFLPCNCRTILQARDEATFGDDNTRNGVRPIWDSFNSTAFGFQDQELFLKRYLCNHRKLLKRMTWTKEGDLNLFLPHLRGGMGFELPFHPDRIPVKENGDPLVRITKFQRDLATSLATRSRVEDLKIISTCVIACPPEEVQPGELSKKPKKWSLPFSYQWEHESEYPSRIPDPPADPVLSELPEEAPSKYQLRKPRIRRIPRGSSKMIRLCQHPPIATFGDFKRVGGDVQVGVVHTYPTELFSFPYVRTRSIDPRLFWESVFVAYAAITATVGVKRLATICSNEDSGVQAVLGTQ